jgi:hypothetical protein
MNNQILRHYLTRNKIVISLFILSAVMAGLFLVSTPRVEAQSNLIVCESRDNPGQCGFNDLMQLARNLVTFLVIISTFLATAVFIFGGIKLLTSAGNENAMKETKTMLMKVLIGYIWILVAWVLVYTIMSVLLQQEYTQLLN